MPTPLMPDEEFDAQFRLGFEHYPEQPEDPAAWHRMERLLDADLRQQALRRRVLRLLGAEAVLLLLGVWAALSFLQARLPMAGDRPLLASATRVKTAPAGGAERRLTATATQVSTSAKPIAPTPTALLNKQPALAAKAAPLSQAASSKLAPVSNSMAATSHSRRPRGAAPADKHAAASLARAGAHAGSRHFLNEAVEGATATRNRRVGNGNLPQASDGQGLAAATSLAEANHKLTFYHGKRRLHRSAEAPASGRSKAGPALAATAPEKAFRKAPHLLGQSRRYAAVTHKTVVGYGAASAALPIDLLAPRWPVSDLHFQLPDSLALLTLPPAARPVDSLEQPKPRPLLSAYRLRLGLVGAPEFSTVRADRLSKPGSSLGVQLEYQLGRRWRISTGYLYTNKLYVARGSDYTLPAGYTLPHGYVISNVGAACRIVDIPLNLRYDLWQRPSYQVFASVGLSSLLMRREQYTYDYELVYGKPVAPYSWELDNGSQHMLKVLNLSAGYERAVGQRWTVQAEPFVKLPLAGVGFGAVRLSSAGVFFSLKYGLLPVHSAPAPR